MTRPALQLRMRDQLKTELRDRIVSGALKAGAHLEEVALAEKLGSSRTPLREALLGLEQEGLVVSRPHRGFIVAPADPRIVRELYPVLGSLEALVIESSIEQLHGDVPLLARLNADLASAPPAKAAAADRAFHQALRRRCGNRRLLDLLTSLEANAHRLDGAMRRGMADPGGSHLQHAEIVAAISARDAVRAAAAVREHWRRGELAVLAWMAEHEPA